RLASGAYPSPCEILVASTTSRCVSSIVSTPSVPTAPTSRLYTAPGQTIGRAQGMDAWYKLPPSNGMVPGGGIGAFADGCQCLVHRARVNLHGSLRVHHPHDDIESVGPRDHHRRNPRRIVGALVVVQRHEPVHERSRGDQRHLAKLAG